ncbi:HAMP domain-containing sensor histidine kinase [Staphylococcus agnetis]|uniref:histidine kinase n=1 Tax=Staphylococcus agnetis TaxID=985762 RepID=A0ABX3Z3M1_9STAP|nr:HAMP domain-containing sensor histidine kinase [Staphylococcus agnetis]OSP19039.1 sensor histidine kinase [Staphylococcus agnetis]OSP24398.1 sensor histidine kinase [Staphylococcus agnetis]OTW31515.1 sensor histidine kinase [Staphylococcus agnetis]
MIFICVVVLVVISVVLGSQYVRLLNEVNNIERQLKILNEDTDTNQVIRSASHMKQSQPVIRELNRYIHHLKEQRQFFRKKELMLNKEINNVSHDLRTPLTAIKGYTELMQETQNVNEMQSYAQIIDKKTTHLIHSVNLFHELTYINALDYELDLHFVNISEFIQDQLISYYHQFTLKNIDLTFEITTAHYAYLHEESMIRVLDNVIQNALRYAKSSVKISILDESEHVTVNFQNDTDHEPSPEQLHQLFERSYTLDESRTHQQTGVGLYIVKTLMQRQSGDALLQFNAPMFEIRLTLQRDTSCVT